MGLVYASDVKHDGEMARKRGDAFKTSDAKELFDMKPEDLVAEGVVVMDTALPENNDESRSSSFYELQAQMLRESKEALEDSSPATAARKVVEQQGKTKSA